jgi:hypothetical protein
MASAADLAKPSRIGEIFAEPAERHADMDRPNPYYGPVVPYSRLPNPIWAQGGYNYGSYFSSFNGGAYYGGPNMPYVVLLPYACKFYGYC